VDKTLTYQLESLGSTRSTKKKTKEKKMVVGIHHSWACTVG
jgi:hypothetical protein